MVYVQVKISKKYKVFTCVTYHICLFSFVDNPSLRLMMSSDQTFFTNEPGSTLLDRFKSTLTHVKYFDVLVGYFRSSGFHRLYESMESIDKIRILVGLNIDRKTYDVFEESREQNEIDFESHYNTKRVYRDQAAEEMENSSDTLETEIGIKKFLEFLTTECPHKEQDIAGGGNGKKLEIRVFPDENLHAKVYISRFRENLPDFGRVITGSSNFTESGLIANREFNVELKNRSDVDFALRQFEELWKNGADVSKDYVDTVVNNTWLREDISPYHLYLKMLYEYFLEDINIDQEIDFSVPEGFIELQYQKQAVVSAKKILDAYKGVFIADVVGLGKTYISALLAQQLSGGILIICPPVLKEYWKDTFYEFRVPCIVESIGKLDHILRRNTDKFSYIIIDEAHRFRNEYTQSFEKLHKICFGKKIILVSATPLNNKFDDIFSQLKLFQVPKNSTIPGVPNLDKFFARLNNRLKDYKKTDPEYFTVATEGADEIREKVLKYVTVRRTRNEIREHYDEDIKKQNLFFPEMHDPQRIIYEFDDQIDRIFNKTIEFLKAFRYARYTPLLYKKKELSEFEKQSQRNVGGFMKGILVKRLESSFYAFRKSLRRFIDSYEKFIEMFEGGTVLISKKVNVYDLLEEDNEEKIQRLIEEEKVDRYEADEFKPVISDDLHSDLEILKQILRLWKNVDVDPKLDAFVSQLKTNKALKSKKAIIFTESKETGDYLFGKLQASFGGKVAFYSSSGGEFFDGRMPLSTARDVIKESFDPMHAVQKNDLRLLISTDVLAEGVNLHRSNIVINYDLPWNPTRVLQRVGRVNRIGTKHKHIFIYNFFPTAQSDKHINLENNIKTKIQAFHDTLGEDAKYLTEEEIPMSHELFGDSLYKKLNKKETYQDEDEEGRSELKYLKIMRDIRDKKPELFNKIKNLPKKARSGMKGNADVDCLLSFFRKGKLKKFYISDNRSENELTFFDAVDLMECAPDTRRKKIPNEYYDLLKKNKEAFAQATIEEDIAPDHVKRRGGRSNEAYVVMRLKANEFKSYHGFTDRDEEFIREVLLAYRNGTIPKNTTKRIKQAIERETNPMKVFTVLKRNVSENQLAVNNTAAAERPAKREVILSEYLKAGDR